MPLSAFLPSTFLLTLFVLYWFQKPTYPLMLWGAMGMVILGSLMLARGKTRRIVLFSVAGMATALIATARVIADEGELLAHAGMKVTIDGVIDETPDNRQNLVTYVIDVQRLRTSATGAWIPTNGRALVTDKTAWPRHAEGSRVHATGKLEAVTMNGEDYDDYLRMRRIDARIARSTYIALITAPKHMTLNGVLTQMRDSVEARISLLFHEPDASLMKGLLTGSRQDMPDALREAFRTTGLTHIVAISGFNITIIMTAIGSLLFFLPFKWRLIPSIIGVALFTLFVGASASVVRAAIMGSLGLVAMQSGRMAHVRLSILWSAFAMLIISPLSLWYDAGFQLSFLAVIGLAELSKPLEPLLRRLPTVLGLRETLSATIAASMSAMPWAAFRFGTVSIISPLANVFVVPLVPLAMFFGFMATVVGFAWLPMGRVASIPAYVLLQAIIESTMFFSHVPLAAFTWDSMHPIVIIGYYTALISWRAFIDIKKRPDNNRPLYCAA